MSFSLILVSKPSLESPNSGLQNALFKKKIHIRFDPKRFECSDFFENRGILTLKKIYTNEI